jgi:hypothetical protein
LYLASPQLRLSSGVQALLSWGGQALLSSPGPARVPATMAALIRMRSGVAQFGRSGVAQFLNLCLTGAALIRMCRFGTRWHGQIWIAVLLATLQGAEALDNMVIPSERRLQVVEDKQVQGWVGHIPMWSAWLIVWLSTFVIGYKLGHQQAVKQHLQGLVKEAAVQTREGIDDLDSELVHIMNNTYTLDILRKAARQHGCCPGHGARKLNVIETLVRNRKVTRVNHVQVMSAAGLSVH